MLAKVLVLALVAAAACEEHGYTIKAVHHQPAQDYRHHYEHVPIRIQEDHEPAHEGHYSGAEGHGHAYSSQSVIHHGGHKGQEESQEAHGEHVAPVYQYVQEEEEAPTHHPRPTAHYQSIQYPALAPEHQEHIPVHGQQPHASIHVSKPHVVHVQHAQPHYAHGEEQVSYHHAQPQYAHGHEEVSYHGLQQHAEPIHHAEPVHHAIHAEAHSHVSHDEPVDYYAYPKYQYEYKVEDPHTGDNKFQHEYRDGDVVKGVYGLQEADGSIRTVEYSSDKDHGFSAIVKHSSPNHHVQIESHHQN